ncbi:MAG: lipocalin-like domain-containing protein [Muribaculaceae bacterium]|nr:lipocalin-like domain-containing protein [Muribaculaceae bacterium]
MKKVFFALILALVVCSCQNDGHIGNLFGTWSLTEMTVNGQVPEDFESGQTTWNFQNNIIVIILELPHYEYVDRTGTWEKSTSGGKKQLILNYTHSEPNIAPGTNLYEAPTWLGFPKNEVFSLDYVKDTGREIILTRTTDSGDKYVYTLKKTW